MASPFNIIANTAPLPVPSPNAHPRPDWLRVKFLGGERYQDLKRTMRETAAAADPTADLRRATAPLPDIESRPAIAPPEPGATQGNDVSHERN